MTAVIFKLVNSCFLVITIGHASPTTPPKSVNLAVETSFLFEPHDMKQNTSMLSNVHQFLNKLENLLSPDENREPTFRAQNDSNGKNENNNGKHENNNGNNENNNGKHKNSNGKHENKNGKHENNNDNRGNNNGKSTNNDKNGHGNSLTKFLSELGGIVINYDEEEVVGLTAALNNEIANNYVENPKFHDMFRDNAMKIFIKNTVQEWTVTNPLKLKVEIAKYLTSNEGSAFITFFHNLNEFFENDKTKMRKLVKRFVKARKTKEFAKPLEKTFDLIFDRYGKLDDYSKNRLREELNKLSRHVVLNFKHRLINNNSDTRRHLNDATAKDLSENVKEDFKNSIDNAKIDENEFTIDENIQVSVHANSD